MAETRWQQLAETLRRDLAAMPPGTAVLGDNELAERYGVARMTAAQAIRALADEGLVLRVKGHGTTVRDLRPILLHDSRYVASAGGAMAGGPWSVAVTEAGMRPGVKVTSVDRLVVDQAPADVRQYLDSGEVIRRQRIMSADDQPGALTTSWIPAGIADGTPLAEPGFIARGTYQAMRDAGFVPKHGLESVRSRFATEFESKALRLSARASVLDIVQVTYGKDDRVLQVLQTIADSTRVAVQYVISF